MEIKMLRELPPLGAFPPPSEHKPALIKEAICLDTETSHIGDAVGWIYQWAFCLDGKIAIGRKPSELMAWLQKIAAFYGLRDDLKMLIFVHNLSYDIQYLKNWIFEIWPDYKILATALHKFISIEAGPFIWHCTYRLSNRSLAKWGEDLGVKERKKSGMISYEVIRYQDTRLKRSDWIYQIFDVLGLAACVKAQNILERDTLMSMPLTSTAYVRRDGRRIFKRDAKNRVFFLECKMDAILYKAFHYAFAGGITQGNRFLADQTIEKRGAHGDFLSHYPTQQRSAAGDEMRGYPAGKMAILYQTRGENDITMAQLWEWAADHCLLIQVTISDMEIKRA